VEVKSLGTVLPDLVELVNSSYTKPYFRMVKNWQNSGFLANFWMEFAPCGECKMAFLVAKSFAA